MGGGGVSGAQKNTAAGNLANMATTATGNMNQQYGQGQQAGQAATGFFANRLANGLPGYRNMTDFSSGDIAQAYAPIRADLMRRTGGYTSTPSGYRDALFTNLGAQQGRAFDSTLMQARMANEMAKQQGAAGMQGEQQIAGNQALGYGSLGAGTNQSLLYGPSKPTAWGTVGGLLQQGMQTAGDLAKAGAFKG
jgi:hypothetical protein